MNLVNVTAEVDADDVIRAVPREHLAKVLDRRCAEEGEVSVRRLVENVWLHYRNRGDAPECVRVLVDTVLGRVL